MIEYTDTNVYRSKTLPTHFISVFNSGPNGPILDLYSLGARVVLWAINDQNLVLWSLRCRGNCNEKKTVPNTEDVPEGIKFASSLESRFGPLDEKAGRIPFADRCKQCFLIKAMRDTYPGKFKAMIVNLDDEALTLEEIIELMGLDDEEMKVAKECEERDRRWRQQGDEDISS